MSSYRAHLAVPFFISLQISSLTLFKTLLIFANHDPFQILSYSSQEDFFCKAFPLSRYIVEKTTARQNKLEWARPWRGVMFPVPPAGPCITRTRAFFFSMSAFELCTVRLIPQLYALAILCSHGWKQLHCSLTKGFSFTTNKCSAYEALLYHVLRPLKF